MENLLRLASLVPTSHVCAFVMLLPIEEN